MNVLIDRGEGKFECPACHHVHANPGEVILGAEALACAGCGAPVAFEVGTFRRALKASTGTPDALARHSDAVADFSGWLLGLFTTREVVAVAIPPACLKSRFEVARAVNGVALVDTLTGDETHMTKIDALNLLLALARESEFSPPFSAIGRRISIR